MSVTDVVAMHVRQFDRSRRPARCGFNINIYTAHIVVTKVCQIQKDRDEQARSNCDTNNSTTNIVATLGLAPPQLTAFCRACNWTTKQL